MASSTVLKVESMPDNLLDETVRPKQFEDLVAN